MGRKMKLSFLSKNTEARPSSSTAASATSSTSTWPWPSCTQTRTVSFRTGDDIFKTINSAYLESTTNNTAAESLITTHSPESEESGSDPVVEAVARGLRSERLFFEPGETSSILEEAKQGGGVAEVAFKQSVVLCMDSRDPYLDFKRSMEEMVEAHGLKDWDALEQLLSWYLKVNGKTNHAYIVAAFVDLLVALAISSSCSNCNSPNTPFLFYNTTTATTTTSNSSTSTSSSFSSSSSSSITTAPCCISSTEAEDEIESSSATTTPCLSSLVEAREEDSIHEEDDDDDDVNS